MNPYAQINDYLEKNKNWLSGMSVDFIVMNVHIFVPQAYAQLQPSDVRSQVAYWRYTHGPDFSNITGAGPQSTQLPASADGKLLDLVKNAVKTITDGIDIGHGAGKINIGVGGLTTELTKGDAKVSAGLSWGQTLKVGFDKGDFHFAGELASDHWKIELTYPEDNAVPISTELGDVVTKGEKAMQNIAGATADFKTLNDFAKVKATISPNIKPVQDAVEAVQGLVKASPPKKRVNFGISAGSPDQLPGQTGIPGGVEVKGVVTFFF